MTYDVEHLFIHWENSFKPILGISIYGGDWEWWLIIHLSINLFNKYLLNVFYGPGTVLGPYVNETDAIVNSQEILIGGMEGRQH